MGENNENSTSTKEPFFDEETKKALSSLGTLAIMASLAWFIAILLFDF